VIAIVAIRLLMVRALDIRANFNSTATVMVSPVTPTFDMEMPRHCTTGMLSLSCRRLALHCFRALHRGWRLQQAAYGEAMTTSADDSHQRLPCAVHDHTEPTSPALGDCPRACDIEMMVLSNLQDDPLVQRVVSGIHDAGARIFQRWLSLVK
jgi:hypothetical protein